MSKQVQLATSLNEHFANAASGIKGETHSLLEENTFGSPCVGTEWLSPTDIKPAFLTREIGLELNRSDKQSKVYQPFYRIPNCHPAPAVRQIFSQMKNYGPEA